MTIFELVMTDSLNLRHYQTGFNQKENIQLDQMKKVLLPFMLLFCGILSIQAQKNVTLNITHEWNGTPFIYGQKYYDHDGNAVEITRVQYYLSGIKLTHDAGSTTTLTGTYVLASGNISSYPLDTASLTSLEGVSFDVGVDAATNHLDPTLYAPGHPLGLQSPSMHWGWSAGYRFLVIEGKVDSNGDDVPDASFEFHVTADDSYLTPVTAINTSGSLSGSDLTVEIYANIADWLKDITLKTAGSNHGAYPINGTVMTNTNTYTVFDAAMTTSSQESVIIPDHSVHFNYSKPYAPTIFYKFSDLKSVDLSITDATGNVVLNAPRLDHEGNFFIEKELASGIYIATFSNEGEMYVSKKFVVQR